MSESQAGKPSDIYRRTLKKSAEIAGLPSTIGPKPGGIHALAATAEWAIEWALIDVGSDGRFLSVAADAFPAIAASDVAVPKEEGLGALALRCGHGEWLPPALFDGSASTGALSADTVRIARERFDEALEGRLTPSPVEARTEERLDYREWISENVTPATRTIAAAAAQVGTSKVVVGDFSAAASTPRSESDPAAGAPWALKRAMAASIWVGLIGLAALSGWQFNEIQALKADLDSGRGAYGSERPYDSSPEVNVDLHWLLPSVVERGEAAIPFSRESLTSVWVLQLQDATPYPSYRVRIRNDDEEIVWDIAGLHRNETMEVNLAIPTRSLAPGRYTFELYAVPGPGDTGPSSTSDSVALDGSPPSDLLLDRYLVSIDDATPARR